MGRDIENILSSKFLVDVTFRGDIYAADTPRVFGEYSTIPFKRIRRRCTCSM